MAWYAKVLGAKELSRVPLPNGRLMHAAMRLGDTLFMLADSFGPAPPKMAGVTLHVHDAGIDGMWDRAVKAGAQVVMPLADQFWGDRYGQLRDPWGHLWSFGWPTELSAAEKKRLEAEAMAIFVGGPPLKLTGKPSRVAPRA